MQGGARLDAELVDEQTARVPIDVERLGLPAGAVERSHERRAEPLAQRVRLHEHLELGDELGVVPERQVGFDAPLEGAQPELFESSDLRLRERLVRQVGERGPSPEAERVTEQPRRELRLGPLRLLHQPLETMEVELVRAHADRGSPAPA